MSGRGGLFEHGKGGLRPAGSWSQLGAGVVLGHLASFSAYAIFGLNIILCKDIASEGSLSPLLLFTLRAFCAGVLFWLLSLFTPREAVPAADLMRMAGAGMLGLVIPQLTFLTAITMTAPIDLSVVQSTTPIMTMFVAAIFLKEPISWQKAGGVALSFAGVLWLILQSTHAAGIFPAAKYPQGHRGQGCRHRTAAHRPAVQGARSDRGRAGRGQDHAGIGISEVPAMFLQAHPVHPGRDALGRDGLHDGEHAVR